MAHGRSENGLSNNGTILRTNVLLRVTNYRMLRKAQPTRKHMMLVMLGDVTIVRTIYRANTCNFLENPSQMAKRDLSMIQTTIHKSPKTVLDKYKIVEQTGLRTSYLQNWFRHIRYSRSFPLSSTKQSSAQSSHTRTHIPPSLFQTDDLHRWRRTHSTHSDWSHLMRYVYLFGDALQVCCFVHCHLLSFFQH